MSTAAPVPRPVPRRDDLTSLVGYHSAQVEAEVRLNTNESPFPPPEQWRRDLAAAIAGTDFNRYPDREATELRQAIATDHGVEPEQVFCANGSNEVLQCLLLAYGGPGRQVLLFEPTYALHTHISHVTGTEVVTGSRDDAFRVDRAQAKSLQTDTQPVITFLCSPNNPTGRAEPDDVVDALLADAPGLLVVDEAYGQFARTSALSRFGRPGAERLVVVRTFSKTWSMAGIRLGYLIADPAVVESCNATALPYHLSTLTQLAGVLALGHRPEMEARVALVAEERGRVAAALDAMLVDSWTSDANFILFRPQSRDALEVWQELLEAGVLVRDCSSWAGLGGCLRVTIGTPEENSRFLAALGVALEATPERSLS